MADKIYFDVPYNLIQSIRFIHAMMESKYTVYIPVIYRKNFILLQKKFNLKYKISNDKGSMNCLTNFNLSHKTPATSIGNIKRALIFPHAIVNFCKENWSEERNLKYTFIGLITPQRETILKKWIERIDSENKVKIKKYNSKQKIWLYKFLKLFNYSKFFNSNLNTKTFHLFSSTKGRVFPYKSWDEQYFKTLTNSKFVLCPNGDFVWSYRFFESILCGAIPIIEEYCDIYNGFKYKFMKNAPVDLEYSHQDALYNYNLCKERLTVPLNLLNKEIERML